MKILVVPDIHQSIRLAQEVLDTPHDWDKVVFLGDYLDSHYQDEFDDVSTWLEQKFEEYGDLATWLVGNHEIHYIVEAYSKLDHVRRYEDLPIGCSGYSRNKAKKIKGSDFFKKQFFPRLQLCHYANNVVFSHAGFCTSHFSPRVDVENNLVRWENKWEEFFDLLRSNHYDATHSIWQVGFARGGMCNVSSPLWLDFRYEFSKSPPSGVNQVFGHTHNKLPRVISRDDCCCVCLDTGLAYYAIVDEDQIKIYDSFNHKEFKSDSIRR